MSDKNPDLVALQRALGDVVDRLVQQQEQSNDPEAIEALGRQIREASFRAIGLQRKLFAQQTAAIAAAVEDVQRGKAEVEEAIARIEQLNQAIATVTKFLSLVDKVLALVP
jgi:septum formation inhibitor MinC